MSRFGVLCVSANSQVTNNLSGHEVHTSSSHYVSPSKKLLTWASSLIPWQPRCLCTVVTVASLSYLPMMSQQPDLCPKSNFQFDFHRVGFFENIVNMLWRICRCGFSWMQSVEICTKTC